MGFWGKLFGTEKALSAVVDGVSNGLDALVYTDEEKAGDAAKERTEARQMVVEWMGQTKGQNLSRRLIALSITFTWLFLKVSSLGVGIVAIFSEHKDKLKEVITLIKENSADMTGAVMVILSFYFAAPYAKDITVAALKKFGNRNSDRPE